MPRWPVGLCSEQAGHKSPQQQQLASLPVITLCVGVCGWGLNPGALPLAVPKPPLADVYFETGLKLPGLACSLPSYRRLPSGRAHWCVLAHPATVIYR